MKLLFGVTDYLDFGPTASFVMLPATEVGAEAGVAWGFGGGLRIKRAYDAESAAGLSPWVDGDLLYMRTGPLNRVGFDAGVGVTLPVDRDRNFRIGPFARYMQTVQPETVGFDNRDARVLSVGLTLEAGTGLPREVQVIHTVTNTVTTSESCPDRDADGVPDMVDHCPDVVGPPDNWGCPVREKVAVSHRLEIKEKVYFEWDKSAIEPVSYPVLDEVVAALTDDPNMKVQVDGHTDSTGPDAHNQDLSEERAGAVITYLVRNGISRDRLTSRGFASSQPVGTNATEAEREDNRRVEFVVSFIIVNPGSAN